MAVTLDMIKDARRAMQGIVRNTPLDPAPHVGRNIYIKAENLQLTGSFKLRGAYNKIRSLTSEEAARGVIACSAGNHAQGIAYSASMLGIRSTICMPAGAPLSKVESTKGYGAEVVLVPGVYDDAAREARRLAQEQGYTFAHPFDDPLVIAGQGTIGLEILEQLPQVEQVIVPIGGGGLISGIAVAIKTLKPSCRIIGVQAAKAASMYLSQIEGAPVELTSVATIADGIAVKKPGELTFALCQRYVDEIITVSEGEIACAILRLIEGQKTVAEGAGAAAVAAALFGKVDTLGRPTRVRGVRGQCGCDHPVPDRHPRSDQVRADHGASHRDQRQSRQSGASVADRGGYGRQCGQHRPRPCRPEFGCRHVSCDAGAGDPGQGSYPPDPGCHVPSRLLPAAPRAPCPLTGEQILTVLLLL